MSENSIELVIAQNPVLAITDKTKFEELLKGIRAEIDAHKPDVSTPKGRKEIASLAYKVTRTKTAIDDAGKELNAAKRKEIDVVDAERRAIRTKLDELADEIRKPLTEWEEAEKARTEKAAEILNTINTTPWVAHVSESIREAIAVIEATEIDPEIFRDDLSDAVLAKQERLDALKDYLAAAVKHEADRAELQRLRDEAEARAEEERIREHNARIEKEAAIQREREQAEAEKRERDRLAAIAEAAENARKQEAAKAAVRAVEQAEAAHEAIAKANRERDAEIEKNRREQEARDAEAAAIEKERLRREKDRDHRGQVMKAAKEAIMSVGGVTEPVAKQIVLAIIASEIPNVRLEF